MSALAMTYPRQNWTAKPFDITRRDFRADPYPFYAWMRAERPVFKAKQGGRDVWLVARYDDVVALLKDERFVKNPANVKDPTKKAQTPWMPAFIKPLATNMLDQDDPNHARLRALVHKAFTPGRIEEMNAHIQ